MKTKLLRKVRKEFKITLHHNGLNNKIWNGIPITILTYKLRMNEFPFYNSITLDEKFRGCGWESVWEAKEEIVRILRQRYPHLGSYRKKFTKQQIWP